MPLGQNVLKTTTTSESPRGPSEGLVPSMPCWGKMFSKLPPPVKAPGPDMSDIYRDISWPSHIGRFFHIVVYKLHSGHYFLLVLYLCYIKVIQFSIVLCIPNITVISI